MYDNPRFQPEFQIPPMLPPELMHLQPELDSICSDSISCIYDYVVSYGNKELAIATKKFESIAFDIANVATLPVVRCPALPKPANGMKSENRYWPGKVVRFSCDIGYRLVGYEARHCREDGLWTWGEDPECISEWRYFLIMSGSIMAAFVPMAVTIAAGVFCLMFIVRRSRSHYTGEQGDDIRSFREQAASSASLTNKSRRSLDETEQLENRYGLNDNEDDDDDDDDDEDLENYEERRRAPRANQEELDDEDDNDEDDDDARIGDQEQVRLADDLRGQRPPVIASSGRPIGSRGLFDTRTTSVYGPTTTTTTSRTIGPSGYRQFTSLGGGTSGTQTQPSNTMGLPLRPKPGRGGAEPDYGPLREARI